MTTNSAQEFPFDKYLKNMFSTSTEVAFGDGMNAASAEYRLN